mmetsp:Transcript_20169/g.52003  ORF Transcript_20169/g.52003 Transcript_20169/m.52003 type:complete len:187 (+) Transcript_20169:71-631(+)
MLLTSALVYLAVGAPAPIPLTTNACDIIDVDARLCSCTDLLHQKFVLDCEVPLHIKALNFSDTFGIKVIADPCDKPASMKIDVVEKMFGIDVPIEKIVAGTELLTPIPGLAINIPNVGEANIDLDISFGGDVDEIEVKAGINACIKSSGEQICGQDIPYLQDLLPIWVIDGTWQVGHLCGQTASIE